MTNADLSSTMTMQIMENTRQAQRRQNLGPSQGVPGFPVIEGKRGTRVPARAVYKENARDATRIHLDVEMETGTGKTYCYIKTASSR